MKLRLCPFRFGFFVFSILALLSFSLGAETVRVATYNLENYLVMDRMVDERWRPDYPKPEKEKHALREAIATVDPDILAVQEIGGRSFLRELQRDLKGDGLDYPHADVLEGADEVRHIGVLSRLPFDEVRPHVEGGFSYFGDREKIRRGLLEVVFETGGEKWSLLVVHLKSKWTERPDDPRAERKRTGEATLARNTLLEIHDPDAGALYLIAGDFNDTLDTAPLRRFLKRGDVTISKPIPAGDSRGHTWTHFWERQHLYSRVDFLLASPALFAKVAEGRGTVYDGPGHATASDHRLVWVDLNFCQPEQEASGGSSVEGERMANLWRSFGK